MGLGGGPLLGRLRLHLVLFVVPVPLAHSVLLLHFYELLDLFII